METGPRVLEDGRAHPVGVENVWLKELDSQLASIEDDGGELGHQIRTIGTQQEEVIIEFYLSEPEEEPGPTATFPRVVSSNAVSDVSEHHSGAGPCIEKENSAESASERFYSSQSGGEPISENSVAASDREKSLVVSDRDKSAGVSDRETSVPFSDPPCDDVCTFPIVPPTEPAGEPAGLSTFFSNVSSDKPSVEEVQLETDVKNRGTVIQNEDSFDPLTQFRGNEEKEPNILLDQPLEEAKYEKEQSPEHNEDEFSRSPSSIMLVPPPVPKIMAADDADESAETAKESS